MESPFCIKYKINHSTSLVESVDEFLKSSQSENYFKLNKYGNGSVEAYKFHEGLSIQISKFLFHQPTKVKREGTENSDLIILDFHVKGKGSLDLKDSKPLNYFNYGAYFSSSNIKSEALFLENIYNEQIHIIIDKNWLLSSFPETIKLIFAEEKLLDSFFIFERLSSELTKVVYEVVKDSNLTDFRQPFLEGKTLEILSLFFRQLKNREHRNYSYGVLQNDVEKVFKLEEYIKQNLSKDLSIANLSNQIGFSESKLQKLFKSIYGKSVHKRITEIKMIYSLELLENKQFTISEIGYKMGYQNMSHFSNAFKKVNGFLPSKILDK